MPISATGALTFFKRPRENIAALVEDVLELQLARLELRRDLGRTVVTAGFLVVAEG